MRRAVGLPDAAGVLVRGVEDNGPAFAAGIAEGDLITRVGSHDIGGIDDLHDALDTATPGVPLAMTVLRGVEEIEVTVTIPGG